MPRPVRFFVPAFRVIVFLLVGAWAVASLLRRGERAKERGGE